MPRVFHSATPDGQGGRALDTVPAGWPLRPAAETRRVLVADAREVPVLGRLPLRRGAKRLRSCPRCGHPSLAPTGIYWACSTCHYAITEQALRLEQREAPAEGERDREVGTSQGAPR